MGSSAYAQQTTVIDTSGFVTLATTQTISGLKTFSSRVVVTAPGTSNSSLRVGSLEFQPLALNTAWMGENVFYNGANFQYRQTGAAGIFLFQGQEGSFRFVPSGVAGAVAPVDIIAQFKVNAGTNTVAMGGMMGGIPGDYTNAAIVANNNGSLFNRSTSYGVSAISGNQVLALGSNSRQSYSGAGGAWTMPPIAGTTGLEFVIKNRGTGALDLVRAGADQIFNGSATNLVTLAVGDGCIIWNDGSFWNFQRTS